MARREIRVPELGDFKNVEIVEVVVKPGDQVRCLLYTSDAADERSSVDLGGRRIIKKKNNETSHTLRNDHKKERTIGDSENKVRQEEGGK